MDKMKKARRPNWRRSILYGLDIETLCENLDEIAGNGSYYGYEDNGCEGEYYAEYKPLFDELAMGAEDLSGAIGTLEEYDPDGKSLDWDDFTVALMGGVREVWGYDAGEMDYFKMFDFYDEDAAVDAAAKRIEKLTKKELIRNFRRVMVLLLAYMDIKCAYDTLNTVVCELDDRAAAMQGGRASERMFVE